MFSPPLSIVVATLLFVTPNLQAKQRGRNNTQKVRVAMIAGFTGTDPNTANELFRGVDIFFHQNPEARNVIDVVKFDNKGSVLDSATLTEKIYSEGFRFIVGLARSDEALAVAKIASERNMLFLTPFATNSKISASGPTIFQTCFSDDFQGRVLAHLTEQTLKPKRIQIFTNSDSIYSTGLTDSYLRALKASIEQPESEIGLLYYKEGSVDVARIEREIARFKPDLVFIPDHITRAAQIAKIVNRVNPSTKFLGGDGFGGKKILTGIFGDTPRIELFYTTHWHEDLPTQQNRTFISGYKNLYQKDDPTSGAALMYDSLNILFKALRLTNGLPSVESVSRTLRAGIFETTTGSLQFRSTEKQETRKLAVVLRLKDRRYGFFQTAR